MREHRQIVERWTDGSALILVTLVRVQGSSYRQPGARLLVCSDGTYEGSISAGCLEADLLRKAAWLTRGGATVEQYSTLFDEDDEVAFGLGCGGIIDVLLESVETAECRALLTALQSSLSGRVNLVATFLPKTDRGLLRAVFSGSGELIFASEGLSAESLSHARTNCLRHTGIDLDELFVERLVPPQRLFVFGAGDDAKPLAAMAGLLGWSVTVVDGRTHLAQKSRFPQAATEVVSIADEAIERIDTRDAVVIMTHSYKQDGDYLTALLPREPTYLGLLGSRQRSSLLIAEAATRLELSVSECCERVSAPVGLNIGGEGPEAIALAILAEAQACCTGKGSESRKLSAEHIQRYVADGAVHSYLRSQCALDPA